MGTTHGQFPGRLHERLPAKALGPPALMSARTTCFPTPFKAARSRRARAGWIGPSPAVSNSNERQDESIWFQLRELLGYTGSDPGHWNFSPEWWGSQDGGWGRNEGVTVFHKQSMYNGDVAVTAHPASTNGFDSHSSSSDEESDDERGGLRHDEWRVLRFNSTTRQSVTRVRVYPNDSVKATQSQRPWLDPNQVAIAYPECLAQEYLKSMVSVVASLVGILGLFSSQQPVRVLCIGLGGGSLPMFLLHHFPMMTVDAIEIDPVVIQACAFMGLRFKDYPRLRVFEQDALLYLQQCVLSAPIDNHSTYDIVCIDAFDGQDNVPDFLFSNEFSDLVASILDQERGAIIMNSHSIDVKNPVRRFANALRDSSSCRSREHHLCFVVSTQKQRNTTLAIVHGFDPNSLPISKEGIADQLRIAASYVAAEVGYPFAAGSRATRNLRILSK